MVRKVLERKVEITRCEDSEYLDPFELEYYLLESRVDDEDLGEMTAYGVEIVKRVRQAPVENIAVRNYTYSRESACELICKLADYQVTPVSLEFILDDILGV